MMASAPATLRGGGGGVGGAEGPPLGPQPGLGGGGPGGGSGGGRPWGHGEGGGGGGGARGGRRGQGGVGVRLARSERPPHGVRRGEGRAAAALGAPPAIGELRRVHFQQHAQRLGGGERIGDHATVGQRQR